MSDCGCDWDEDDYSIFICMMVLVVSLLIYPCALLIAFIVSTLWKQLLPFAFFAFLAFCIASAYGMGTILKKKREKKVEAGLEEEEDRYYNFVCITVFVVSFLVNPLAFLLVRLVATLWKVETPVCCLAFFAFCMVSTCGMWLALKQARKTKMEIDDDGKELSI